MFKRGIFSGAFAALLTLFTLYVILDAFVIKRVYAAVDAQESTAGAAVMAAETSETTEEALDTTENEETTADIRKTDVAEEIESTADSAFTAEAIWTDRSYSDENLSISITEHREYDTSIYVAEVYISSAEYLKTAFAKNVYGRNITEKTSCIAAGCGAILAINGDYYGSQSKGYVIRNGVLYRESVSSGQEDLVIWADGSFSVVTEGEYSASELLAQGAVQVLSFGPLLLTDGEVAVTESEEVGKAKASNPRTAIGIVDAGHYLFVVSDGRTQESAGLSLYELAVFMESLGARLAYNLDGGGSSTMVFNGEVVNQPTSSGESIRERSVSDIVYIGQA